MLRPARTTTPQRLIAAMVAVVLAGALAGVAGWRGLSGRADDLAGARAETAHQVRLQTARTKLVIADTNAQDDVLRGTQPKPLESREFDLNMQPALLNLVFAAGQAQDAPTLAVAARYLGIYNGDVETSRTLAQQNQKNKAARQMTAASSLLHTQVLPRLQQVQDASRTRLQDDENRAGRGPLVALLVALLAAIVFAAVHWWLTLRTRRFVNPGLAAGLVLVVAVLVAGVAVSGTSRGQADSVRSGPLHSADQLVEARVNAFDARSAEAIGALNNTVPQAQASWQKSMTAAQAALSTASRPEIASDVASVTALLNAYAKVHAQVLAAAQGGNASLAAQKAADVTEDGSVGSFEDFDASSGALLARQEQAADDGWAASGHGLEALGLLALAGGLLAAALGWWGISGRLREYR